MQEAAVERCLNIALLDHHQTAVIEHLFRLLAQCLREKGPWNEGLRRVLADQIFEEFGYNTYDSWRVLSDTELCGCEWKGGKVSGRHVRGCVCACGEVGKRVGEVMRGRRGVRELVEGMEGRHWILRAWKTGAGGTWLERVMGGDVPVGRVRELGPGWMGIGG